jgi:hypothetical protein
MEQVEDIPTVQRGPFHVEYPDLGFNVADLIEPKPDSSTSYGLLATCDIAQIAHGFACFGKIQFQSHPV